MTDLPEIKQGETILVYFPGQEYCVTMVADLVYLHNEPFVDVVDLADAVQRADCFDDIDTNFEAKLFIFKSNPNEDPRVWDDRKLLMEFNPQRQSWVRTISARGVLFKLRPATRNSGPAMGMALEQ